MARQKGSSGSKSRKALEAAYKATYELIPETVQCAACGLPLRKVEGERHHPAGRRKHSFLFTIVIHGFCHQRIHQNGKWAEENGLMLKSRNSTCLTVEKIEAAIAKQPFPAKYAVEIFLKHNLAMNRWSDYVNDK